MDETAWHRAMGLMFAEVSARTDIEIARMDAGEPPQSILDPAVDDLLACMKLELDDSTRAMPGWVFYRGEVEVMERRRDSVRSTLATIMGVGRMWADLSDDELEHRLLHRGITTTAALHAVANRDDFRIATVIDRWLGEG